MDRAARQEEEDQDQGGGASLPIRSLRGWQKGHLAGHPDEFAGRPQSGQEEDGGRIGSGQG